MPNQTLTFLKHRFDEVGLRLNTRHGQNFLIDLNLQHILVDSAQLSRDDVVLEVGTGTGALSALVAAKAAHLVTVEVDPRLAQLASEELIDCPNVTLLRQDALAGKHSIAPAALEALDRQLNQSPQRRFKLVANLPYNIATPLVANLLALPRPPELMIVTIQNELADRLMAQPSTKDYGALSLWVQCQCQMELLRVMPPEVFWPRPKVHSAIVRITLEPRRRQAIADLEFFHQFVHALFLHRRKLLRGVLAGQYKGRLDKPAIDDLLRRLNLGETTRAEELPVDQMLRLADAVRRLTVEP
jgi:16S rRNA (adenine1518-N6/adenine1519-N6)-dimethyltransferase